MQAYLSLVAGALLSYNLVLPSDEPNIARLMGMWSIWMFTVPSLRARECDPKVGGTTHKTFISCPILFFLTFYFQHFKLGCCFRLFSSATTTTTTAASV